MLKKIIETTLLSGITFFSITGHADLKPFQETYTVSISSFPDFEVTHEISNRDNTDNWEMELSGSAFFGQFSVSEKTILSYLHGDIIPIINTTIYEAPFTYKKNVLTSDNLSIYIDRQSLFIQLSDLANNDECIEDKCSIVYYDHRSKKREIIFNIEKRESILYNGKEIPLNIISGEQDERDVFIALNPEYSGMLLFMSVDEEYSLVNNKIDNKNIQKYLKK